MHGVTVTPLLQLSASQKQMKKIQASEVVQQISILVGDPCTTAKEIGKAGVRLFVLFGVK